MKYLPACILLVCSCVVEMHIAQSICCLIIGVFLTFSALGTLTLPLVYCPTIEQGEPIFFKVMQGDEEGAAGSGEDFDYD